MHPNAQGNDDLMRTRLPRELKARVETAAALIGLDASAFVRRTIAQAAEDVLAAQTSYRMTPEDLAAVAAVLDTPPAPTAAAQRAAERYEARVVHAD
jgi:uncharacterized protein (DUF1778 family)